MAIVKRAEFGQRRIFGMGAIAGFAKFGGHDQSCAVMCGDKLSEKRGLLMATFRICKSFFITPAFNERFKKAAEKADKTQLGFFIEAVEEKIDRMGFEWSNRENGLHDFQGNAESID